MKASCECFAWPSKSNPKPHLRGVHHEATTDTFVDAQGRCYIAGVMVTKHVYDRHNQVLEPQESESSALIAALRDFQAEQTAVYEQIGHLDWPCSEFMTCSARLCRGWSNVARLLGLLRWDAIVDSRRKG